MSKDKVPQYMETHDNIISAWYWRRKYNSLNGDLELLKEVMREDIYKQIIKKLTDPMELTRYKKENRRLRNMLTVTRDERDSKTLEVKQLKKEIKELKEKYEGPFIE